MFELEWRYLEVLGTHPSGGAWKCCGGEQGFIRLPWSLADNWKGMGQNREMAGVLSPGRGQKTHVVQEVGRQ